MDEFKIINTLDKLNIIYQSNNFSKGYINILCPNHNDRNFGSCHIYSNTIIKCYSCGYISNLFNTVKLLNPSFSNKKIFEFLGETSHANKLYLYLKERSKRPKFSFNNSKNINIDLLEKREVDPNSYYYKTRFFCKEFTDRFNIKSIASGFYKDYYLIPIFYKNQIYSYEFRKEFEYEKLFQFLKRRGNLEYLRNVFKSLRDVPKTELTDYLKKPKVLYTSKSNLKNIIFNFDNLDLNNDLFICEGICGIPEIINKYNTRNVTAIFGSNITDQQINLLLKFKKNKIIVSDKDEASVKLIDSLVLIIPDLLVLEDDNTIGASEYLFNRLQFLNNLIIKD